MTQEQKAHLADKLMGRIQKADLKRQTAEALGELLMASRDFNPNPLNDNQIHDLYTLRYQMERQAANQCIAVVRVVMGLDPKLTPFKVAEHTINLIHTL